MHSSPWQNCALKTGGKHYNVHIMADELPAREEEPRSESPIGNFYYPQDDCLIARQEGQPRTWNVIRPEATIGHTSKPNGMTLRSHVLFTSWCASTLALRPRCRLTSDTGKAPMTFWTLGSLPTLLSGLPRLLELRTKHST